MRVRKGTYDDGTPVRWVETRTTWEFTLEQLIDGLCSHYIRNRTEDDEPLPDSLWLTALIRTVRKEYETRGTDNVWTWSDGYLTDEEVEEARAWARGLVLAVLPGLEA